MIVGVDVYVRLSLQIEGSWRADYIEWLLPGPGHVPPLQEGGKKGDRLESRQMPARADL